VCVCVCACLQNITIIDSSADTSISIVLVNFRHFIICVFKMLLLGVIDF